MMRRRLDAADADVDRYVAEIAERVTDRQAEVFSAVVSLIHDEIEELRSDALIDLLHACSRRRQRRDRFTGDALRTAEAARSACAWLPYRASPTGAVEAVRRFLQQRPDAPSVSIGSPAAGVEGFRSSHRQAQAGRSIADARGDREPTVIAATDPGFSVAALLGGDLGFARAWVGETSGISARVFLSCGSSYKLAADQLCLHFNTVKYRVGRAAARRGRPLTIDRIDVELALLLCHWYGAAVLSRPWWCLSSEDTTRSKLRLFAT